MTYPDWMSDALCAEVDTDVFFPNKGGTSQPAKRICRHCPVKSECLRWALAHEVDSDLHLYGGGPYGVFGGCTPAERREIIRAKRKAVA